MILVYPYIVVQTQHIGVICLLGYKIVLQLTFFKVKKWGCLWISGGLKKNCK
ncbi:conserved hypothetical protein [Vibrio chagasii]|nr:conserved hypothetical protein [Vibrio chagasii]CAH6847058.1 conserved hypothetical protein [Vibrio chagasii]CAH6850484.1 conserved hypothetical protein [Vibrio chagasii]CAH6867742.1 conserved hypothetical protein [Vibrio chagasii]CAH6903459.1 conserved hypothetical protein [Vibrio chagasii]